MLGVLFLRKVEQLEFRKSFANKQDIHSKTLKDAINVTRQVPSTMPRLKFKRMMFEERKLSWQRAWIRKI